MKIEQYNPYGEQFKEPPKPEEIEAARRAAGKELEEARKIEEKERPEREREEQAKEKIKEALAKEAPVHEISEKDVKKAEKATGQTLH